MALPIEQVAELENYCGGCGMERQDQSHPPHGLQKFVARDLADSLSRPVLERGKDHGRGHGRRRAGGVLAIVRPDLKIWLCESVGRRPASWRKSSAVRSAAPVLHARRDILTMKARHAGRGRRGQAPQAAHRSPHWEAFQRLLVLKGPGWIDERGKARHYGLLHDLALRKLATYPLPGTKPGACCCRFAGAQPVSPVQ